MSVEHIVYLMAGLPADEALDERGRSLLDRYVAGELDQRSEKRPASNLSSLLYRTFDSWVSMDAGFHMRDDLSHVRTVVGVFIGELNFREETFLQGPYSLADMDAAKERARSVLRRLGVVTEPRILLAMYEG